MLQITRPQGTLRFELLKRQGRRPINSRALLSNRRPGTCAKDQAEKQCEPDNILNVHGSWTFWLVGSWEWGVEAGPVSRTNTSQRHGQV